MSALAVDLIPTDDDQYGEDHERFVERRLGELSMTFGRYVEGIVLGVLVLASLGVAAVSLRRRSLPTWTGAPARLVEMITALSLVVVVSQALGTIGLFRVGPLVVTLALIALLAFCFGKPRAAGPELLSVAEPAPVALHGRQEAWWEPVVAILAVSLVAAEWGAGTLHALRDGVSGVDSLWYHMPISAGFVQSGSVAALHNINNDNVIEFYPATSELLHAVSILLLGSDFVSPLVNALWLGLALFAAWCLGRRYGVGSLTTMATALLLGTTEVIADEPGSAYNDVVGTALVLAALALLAYVEVPWGRRGSRSGALDGRSGRRTGHRCQGHLCVSCRGPDGRCDRTFAKGRAHTSGSLVVRSRRGDRRFLVRPQPGLRGESVSKRAPRSGIRSAAEFAWRHWTDDF